MYRFCIILAVIFSISLTSIYVFIDRQAIFAENLEAKNDQFLIIGESTDLIDGWSVSFCWRKTGGPWMHYYLAHESMRWSDVKIFLKEDRVVVINDEKEIGYLLFQDGSFHSQITNFVQRIPAKIVTASNPFNNSAIYPDSKTWETVWPASKDNKDGRIRAESETTSGADSMLTVPPLQNTPTIP